MRVLRILLGVGVLACATQAAEPTKEDIANAERRGDAVADVALAANLAAFGRDAKSPESLVIAGDLSRPTPTVTPDESLAQVLPPELKITEQEPLYDSARAGLTGWRYLAAKSPFSDGTRAGKEGLCYVAVIEKQ